MPSCMLVMEGELTGTSKDVIEGMVAIVVVMFKFFGEIGLKNGVDCELILKYFVIIK